jgi:crossover junction endodeoxyribonuclease RusA
MSLNVRIYGPPVAQGSMKGFVVKGRAILTSNNAAKLKPWRQQIAETVREMGVTPVAGPLTLTALFYVRRPPSRPKKYKEPDKRPDLDKLLRALMDALTGFDWHDDAQVVRFRDVQKTYATAEEPEGVLFSVEGGTNG